MKTLSLACLALLFTSAAVAGPAWPTDGAGRTGGDNPPTFFFSYDDQVGIAWAVALLGDTGTFALTNIPAGASVYRAFYIASNWADVGGPAPAIEFAFAGTNYGTVPALTSDPGGAYNIGGFAVDVTADVTGNGSYDFAAVPNQSGAGMPGHLLLVIYIDQSLPYRSVTLNVGAENLDSASSTATIPAVQAGDGMLHIFVAGDDAGQTGDVLAFNGATILSGDVYSANQGEFASYLEVPVTTVAGDNTVTVTSEGDWFCWQVAALLSPAEIVSTESRSWSELKNLYR